MWISKVCHFQNMQARITTNCWLGVFCVFLFKTVSGVPRASQRPYGVILAKCWQIWSHKKSERQIRRPLQSVERVGRPSLKYFRTPFCLQHERIFQWNPTVCLQHERTFQWHKSTISHRAPDRRARTLFLQQNLNTNSINASQTTNLHGTLTATPPSRSLPHWPQASGGIAGRFGRSWIQRNLGAAG